MFDYIEVLLLSLLVLVNVFLLYFCAYGVLRGCEPLLKYSAVSPFFFFSVIQFFFLCDFIALFFNPVIDLYELPLYFERGDVLLSYSYYLLVVFCISVGFFYGFNSSVGRSKFVDVLFYQFKGKELTVLSFLFFFVALFASVVLFKLSAGIIDGETTKQLVFRDNKLITIVFSLVPLVFALYIHNKYPFDKKVVLLFLMSLLIVGLTNSRGTLIFIFLIYGLNVNYKVKMVRSVYLLLAMPFLVYLLLWSRYYFREAWRYDSLMEFVDDKGGVFSVFFNTAEVSMAEVITTIVKYGSLIPRYPFESFLAGFMYPMPRSIFEFKPLGASGEFTEVLSPVRWELTKSEIVTTGIGDLYLQFGPIGAILSILFISYYWAKFARKLLCFHAEQKCFYLPLLMWVMYIFFRGDVFNMFGFLWSFLLLCLMMRLANIFRRSNIF